MTELTIGQLAAACGVGVETVRYYQRRGLLEVPVTPAGSGHVGAIRRYGEKDLQTLRFIRSAQKAGFTLSQIEELLELDASHDRTRAREIAEKRLADLDLEIRSLQSARRSLVKLANACANEPEGPCPILTAFDH